MPVTHRFGGSISVSSSGSSVRPVVPPFSSQTQVAGNGTATAADIVGGYIRVTQVGVGNDTVTLPTASALWTALGIPAGQPAALTFCVLNLGTLAADTLSLAAALGSGVTIGTSAVGQIPASGGAVFLATFGVTASAGTATYTVERVH